MTKDSAEKSRRLRERIRLHLPVRVSGRDSVDHEWTEMSRLVDVTPFGARLRLKRPMEVGRLLLLTMAMPRQLRCFDHVEDQYRVWSLVRNLKLLDALKEKGALIEVGVAFVGKRPPRSFEINPARRYEIGTPKSGLWTLQEESTRTLSEISASEKRSETRYTIPTEVTVDVYSENGTFSQREATVTENISPHGAAIFTALELEEGRFVRLQSKTHAADVIAVVRKRRIGADNIARLHLEFIGGEWPV